jgi:hypothetical protein
VKDRILDHRHPTANQGLPSLGAIAAQAALLDPPQPHELPHLRRDEAGLLLDGLLVRVARGRGALDVAVGEGLAALAGGDGALRLGYSGIGDYARERLGVKARTAQAMARLARELRDRPLLRAAVWRGEVSPRKAETVLPVARGDAEEGWVARARGETVRALRAAVEASPGGALAGHGAAGDDERWDGLFVKLSPDERAKLDEAMALAGKLLGPGAPGWQRLEVMCQEFLAAHPVEPGAEETQAAAGSGIGDPAPDWLEGAKAALEQETGQWEFLDAPAPVPVPETGAGEGERDVPALGAELRRLASLRDRWDELVGHLAMLVRMTGLWRDMCFASFGHYCEERLGMSARSVEQRVWLTRRLYSVPMLREAFGDGRVSYEQARLVASVADDTSVEAWIARAGHTTGIALRREIETLEERQLCARGELALRVPRRVHVLLLAALRAARAAQRGGEPWLRPGECLARIAGHFIETWQEALKERSTRQRRVLARDGGFCQVPGCSRPAAHVHHVTYRSRGGGDEDENLVSLCAAHHLHGVHLGYLRVRGNAPDGLRWDLGVGLRPGGGPSVDPFSGGDAWA